jgi:uncharacterized membrane protein YoaT (DUF817 family)
MNGWQFMDAHPFLTFFLACLAAYVVVKVWCRVWRHFDIKRNGWPPQHCDADGDFKGSE